MKKTLLLAAIAILIACKKDSKPKLSQPKINLITKLDLKNAVNLVAFEYATKVKSAVVKNDNSGSVSNSNLFKIKPDGTLENVFYLTKEGEPETNDVRLNVKQIVTINENYLVLKGNFSFTADSAAGPKQYEALLIRKSDGHIFDYGKFDFEESVGFHSLYRPFMFKDQESNIYYRSYSNNDGRKSITKLSLEDPDKIVKEDYMPEGQSFLDVTVDGDGNVAYAVDENEAFRLKRNTGSVFFIPGGKQNGTQEEGVYQFWTGANGKLYLSAYDSKGSYIGIVTFNSNNEIVVNKVWAQQLCSGCEYFGRKNLFAYMRIINADGISFVDPGVGIWKFKESDNSMNLIRIADFSGEIMGISEKNIFLKRDNQLIKISLQDYSANKVSGFTFNDYDIYTMKVYDNDILVFSALRYSDGVKIIARIDTDGRYQVIDDKTNQKAIVLERIN